MAVRTVAGRVAILKAVLEPLFAERREWPAAVVRSALEENGAMDGAKDFPLAGLYSTLRTYSEMGIKSEKRNGELWLVIAAKGQ